MGNPDEDATGSAGFLTGAEVEQIEGVFLRYVDPDDAMSVIQDLRSAGFVIAASWRVVRGNPLTTEAPDA